MPTGRASDRIVRIAAVNEESVVSDGSPLILPETPPLGTENRVIAAGQDVVVSAAGSDIITWGETADQTSITIPNGFSLVLDYINGTWYCFGDGLLSFDDLVDLFTAQGQLFAGTGEGTGELLLPGQPGQCLIVGGSDPSGLEWVNQLTVSVEQTTPQTGPPSSGQWYQGQEFLDTANVLWVCTVSGDPGTWVSVVGVDARCDAHHRF